MADERFYIDHIRQRLLADGYLTDCTHGTPLNDLCDDCELVIGAILRARVEVLEWFENHALHAGRAAQESGDSLLFDNAARLALICDVYREEAGLPPASPALREQRRLEDRPERGER